MTKEHIIYTLGINIPTLTESLSGNKTSLQLIMEEQMLYESFIDSIKTYAKEKWDKTLTTLKDWKDAAVAIGKLISSGNISSLIGPVFRYGIKQPLKTLKALLNKAGLGKFYTDNVIPIINKIGQLDGWKGFIVILSIGSILKYITNKLGSLSAEGLKKWILAYFSDETIENIISKLTDFSTFIGWLQPIVKGTEIIFDILKPSLDRLNRPDIQISENKHINIYNKNKKMKNEALKKLIKEEIKRILSEENETPVKTGAALAKDLRQTGLELTKDTAGLSSMEVGGVKELIDKILLKAKEGNLNTMVIKQINMILDRVKTQQ